MGFDGPQLESPIEETEGVAGQEKGIRLCLERVPVKNSYFGPLYELGLPGFQHLRVLIAQK